MTENQSAETPTAGVTQVTQPEKLLTQHEVNALVGAAKQKGREQGREQTMQELQQSQQNAGANAQPVNQPVQSIQQPLGGADDVRRIAADEIAKQHQLMMQRQVQQAQQADGMRIYNDLQAKHAVASTQDPTVSFDKTLKDFEQMPQILRVANTVDNSVDVIKHLKDNPLKIGGLNGLPENLAVQEIKKLSDSIKQNQQAAAAPKSPEPLSQIRPSNIGVGDSEGQSYSSKFKGQY